MKNIKNILSFLGCAITVMMALSCSLDAGDSSSVELKGTTLIEDILSVREDGVSITPYFNGSAKYVEVVGDADYQSAFAYGAGTDLSSGKAITVSKEAQYVAFKVVDDDDEVYYKNFEVAINKKTFSRFASLTAFEDGEQLPNVVVRKDGDTVYYKRSADVTLRYTFSASKTTTAAPSGATGTELTTNSGSIAIPTSNSKFLLVSVWPAGSDPAVDQPEIGWYEIGAVSSSVLPTCWYNGSTYSHGSNVTIPVGGKVAFVVSADKASGLYADWSSVSSEPSDKNISVYKSETVLNGEIKLEITSNNQAAGYIRCWAKGLDGNYSQTFVLTVTPSTSTTQTSTTDTTTTTTPVVAVNTGNFFVDPSFAGSEVQITFEDRGGQAQRGTIEASGKIPLVVNKGEKISVSLIVGGQWCDAKGNPGAWSQSSSWNGNQVTLMSYSNGGMTPTGATVTWTLQ